MKVTELKAELKKYPDASVRLILPNGNSVPAHAHVTEVGRVDKRFIDCGGTLRAETWCRLQMWVANDVDHRLTAGKLAKIMEKAEKVLLSEDLEVDVEHEIGFVSQFPVATVEGSPGEVVFKLSEKHTDCLAKDQCKPKPSLSEFSPLKFNFRPKEAGCCASKAGEACCSK